MMITPNWLDKRAYLTPEKEAIVLANGTFYSFKQLQTHAKSYAHYLLEKGIQKGEHIGLLSNNCYEMVVTIHALHYIGAVTFLLNTRLKREELLYQLQDGKVNTIIYQQQLESKAKSLKQIHPLTCMNMADFPYDLVTNAPLVKDINLDDLSHIIYTSGTTGYPKGVQLTFNNHWWSATASALNLGLHDNDRWLLSLPMFHVGGLSILYRSVIYGMPVHLHEKFDIESIYDDIMNRDVTIVSVVTLMLEQLVEKLGENTFPSKLRCMLLGGGPAPRALLKKCQNRNIPVFQSYGMTETASQFCTLDGENMLNKLGSAGKPLFPGQLKIVENGQPCSTGEIGEILVKGPSVTQGYWNRPDANKDSFVDGWLKTGDLGFVDEDGFLYVVDRRKDLIISGGENIYPAEIESVLKGINGIQDAGVVGKEDEKWGQVPVAFIVGERSLDVIDIINECKKVLANYKVPKEIIFVDELPRNASKKLMRHQLLKRINGEAE